MQTLPLYTPWLCSAVHRCREMHTSPDLELVSSTAPRVGVRCNGLSFAVLYGTVLVPEKVDVR